jgi:Domain of unknown function (DUF397)
VSTIDLSHVMWRKSSFSNGQGNCVEVAMLPHAIAVRDSKNPTGPMLVFTLPEWDAFLHGVAEGEFSR